MKQTSLLIGMLFVAFLGLCTLENAAQETKQEPPALNVLDFGAIKDGTGDNTAAFQKALDAAGAGSGQCVYVPRGNYRFEGSLKFPLGVTLKGVWESVPSHIGLRNRGQVKPTDDGTTLLVCGNAGKEDQDAFITLDTNCTLKGVCVYYPDQKTDEDPIAYPYTVAMRGKNPAILECELLNPYKGIDASQNERHLIRNISGQPLRMGVFVDSIYDIGRIENVHFNPWWSLGTKVYRWQLEHGEAFVFGKTDWQYVHNTFCFGYNIGYRFIETRRGSCNGNFLGIGADDCYTALVVDQCAPMGLLITNGEFVSFHGPDPTMIRVAPTNKGVVRFSNCAFWGPCKQIAVLDGTGTTGFSDCTFVQWGFVDKAEGRGKDRIDQAAIQAHGGNVILRGCEFLENRSHILLEKNVKKAVISENLFSGKAKIDNRAGEDRNIVIQGNAEDK